MKREIKLRAYHHHHQPYLVRVTTNRKADKLLALILGSNWNLECWIEPMRYLIYGRYKNASHHQF